jgi:8-oxo-dGTP pyrophosphatase MutT (NUDIX family)
MQESRTGTAQEFWKIEPEPGAVAAFRSRIAARLDAAASTLVPATRLRPAAVLVPIVERPEPAVLLTRRTEHLPSHAGQICFPGGRFHPDDGTLDKTALRELEEEVGLSSAEITVAGYLPAYETANSGFLILPVIGFLAPGYTLKVNDGEVAEAFEVPLDFLVDPANHLPQHMERDGVVRDYHSITFAGHVIWGATAAMIIALSERLRAP